MKLPAHLMLLAALLATALATAEVKPPRADSNDSLRPLSLSGLIAPSSSRLDWTSSYIVIDSSIGGEQRVFSTELGVTVPLGKTLAAGIGAPYSIADFEGAGSEDFFGEPRAGLSWFPQMAETFGLGLDVIVGFPSLSSAPDFLDDGADISTGLEVSAFWDFSPTIAFISAGASARWGGADEDWDPLAEAGLMFLLTPELTAIGALEWGLQSSSVPTAFSVVSTRSDVASVRLGAVYAISKHVSGTFDGRIGVTDAAPDFAVTFGLSYGF